MINATYTDILAEIREFFAQHQLVNSFIDGQLYDFQAKENVYSSVVLVPTTSQVQNTQLNLAFDLYFVDRINEDGSNTRDVYNDELQVAQDFISYFSNRRDTWNLDPENINIEPFEQKFADILAGWRLSVSVLLPFYKNVCDIPLDEDAPVPPVPPTPPTPPVFKRNHADLRNLDYEHAGHTGFQKALSSDNAGNNITITHDAQGNAIINAQVPSAAVWGNISGDLENQTDLYNLLQLLQQATNTNANNITTINGKIPAQATSDNQLADKAFVNSSIATTTATFMGTVTAADDTEAAAQTALSSITGMDDNDYAFVVVPNTPQVGVDKYKRYKYNGSAWIYEYTLNNSSFTANQWAAINSGITDSKVSAYDGYATSKQNTLTAGDNITIIGDTISAQVGGAPILYPTTASEVKTTSMLVKSSVSDNGKILTENGFVYNTSGNPTISDTKVICDLGVGQFEKTLENLTQNTEYHIKSYGQNASGLVYGSELVQRTTNNPIPGEYQLVEYIYNNGTAYCRLPAITPTNNYSLYCVVMPSGNGDIFGQATATRFGFGIYNNKVNLFANSTYNFTATPAMRVNEINTVLIDSNRVSNMPYGYALLNSNFGGTDYIGIGTVYVNGAAGASICNCRIYHCYIKDGDTYIYNLYPVYRISDSKPGMYDIVNNVFYINQGTGEFTVGPDKQYE